MRLFLNFYNSVRNCHNEHMRTLVELFIFNTMQIIGYGFIHNQGRANADFISVLFNGSHTLYAQVQRKLVFTHRFLSKLLRSFGLHMRHYKAFTTVKIYYSLWYKLSYKIADKFIRSLVVERILEARLERR